MINPETLEVGQIYSTHNCHSDCKNIVRIVKVDYPNQEFTAEWIVCWYANPNENEFITYSPNQTVVSFTNIKNEIFIWRHAELISIDVLTEILMSL